MRNRERGMGKSNQFDLPEPLGPMIDVKYEFPK